MVFQVYLADYNTTFFTYDSTTCYITLGETTPEYNMPEPNSHCPMFPVPVSTIYSIYTELKTYKRGPFPGNYRREFGELSLQVTTSTDETQPVRRRLYFANKYKHDEYALLCTLEGLTISDTIKRVAEVTSTRMYTLLAAVQLLRNLELCMKLCPRIKNNEGAYIHSVIWHRYILRFGPLTVCGSGVHGKKYYGNCVAMLITIDDNLGKQTLNIFPGLADKIASYNPADGIQRLEYYNQLVVGTKPSQKSQDGLICKCNEAWFIIRTMLATAGRCEPISMTYDKLIQS